jgi:Putative outer membrane beta-barrel porin, MtrB/PioB
MKRKTFAALTACLLFVVSASFAADGEFSLTGSVTLGGQSVSTQDTVDEGKMREYRDLTSGLLSAIDLTGRSPSYYLDFFAENLGRKDMFLDLRGGSYGSFKYRLFSDGLQHNFTFGAKTPYSGAGTATQTATLPNLDPSTWNTYDLGYKRRNDGAMFELSLSSPWYVRAEAGQIRFDGNKLQSFAQGTGSGNGFVDLGVPVDYTTKNYSLETGYSSRNAHVALAYLDSKFENDNPLLRWTNGYFGNNNPPLTSANLGTDTSYLPADNEVKRWSLNALIQKLPLSSSLALRYTASDSTSDVRLATSQLIGSATAFSTDPFNAAPAVFDGKIKYDTWALTWSAMPAEGFDFRLYAYDLKRKNESPQILFTGFTSATSSLGCVGVVGGTGPVGSATGPRSCETEPFGFERKNYGAEVAYRPSRTNRISAGYDQLKTDRDFHPDSDSTKERKYSLEWRNTALDTLVASVKLQRIERRSNFLAAALPNTVWTFDTANMNRQIAKLGLDYTPTAKTDFSAEYYYKKSDYDDTPSGRTADDRGEIYLSSSYGEQDGFRVKAYIDYEKATTDARLVSRNNTTGAINYTVFTGIEDKFEAFGLGFDWPAHKRLLVTGAASWNRSKGAVDFNGLAGASVLPTTLVNITNYGNNDRLALNLKGTYQLTSSWDLTAGVAYEDVTFDDIQFDPYSYILPATPLVGAAQATASYLSGWYRDPAYTATIGYLLAKHTF